MPEWCHCCLFIARSCSFQRVSQERCVCPIYMDFWEQVQVYLYIPFFFSFGACVLFFPHSMFLRVVPDVKVVLIPAFLREALSWLEIVGMYWMHAYSLSSSLFRSTPQKGSMSNRSLVWRSSMTCSCFCLNVRGFSFLYDFCVGGVYWLAMCLSFSRLCPLSS